VQAEDHVVGLDGFHIVTLVGRTRLDHPLDARIALFAALDQAAQRDGRVRDDHLEQRVQLAVVRMHADLAQVLEVREDTLHAGHRRGLAHYLDGVRSKVDLDVQPIFQQTKVFVARAIQRLDSRGKQQRFFYQGFA
jgi:hypothetical protein